MQMENCIEIDEIFLFILLIGGKRWFAINALLRLKFKSSSDSKSQFIDS